MTTYPERLANQLATLHTYANHDTRTTDQPYDGPEPDPWCSDSDSDWAAAREENRRWRTLP